MEKTDGARAKCLQNCLLWGFSVLNSKLVSEPCEEFPFCCKIDHKHYPNFIKHKFRYLCKTLHRFITCIGHTCTRESAVHTSVYTTCLTDKHRKNTH